jgi:TPR repeat protein
MLVLVSAGLAWWMLNRNEEGATPAERTSTRAFTEEAVRFFLSTDPDGPSTLEEAALFEAAGHPDLALLLYRHAARRGEPKAALAIGRMYDPEGFEPTRSAFAAPDADQAASYYEQGAEAGEVEAQFRLGRLLLSGRTSGETDVERGALWLQRAAEQGSEAARAALEEL